MIGILLSDSKEQMNDACSMDKFYRHYTEQKKLNDSIYTK